MRRIITLFVVLVMALSLTCAMAEADGVTGLWYLNIVEYEGVQLDPGAMGMEMTMTLNADGTAAMTANIVGEEEVTEGSWTQEGDTVTVTADGDPMVFTLSDGNLIGAMEDGSVMTFGLERVILESFAPAAPVADATLADFNGTWHSEYVDFSGMMTVPAGSMGVDITLVILDGAISVSELGLEGEYLNYEITGEVSDGIMSAILGDEETGRELTLALLEDGMISDVGSGTDAEMYMITYFAPVTAAE